jgi:hypothetical protein
MIGKYLEGTAGIGDASAPVNRPITSLADKALREALRVSVSSSKVMTMYVFRSY